MFFSNYINVLQLVVFFLGLAIPNSSVRAAPRNETEDGEEFQVFDGRVYNGKYYPKVDIVEWNDGPEPSYMNFSVYSKTAPQTPVEISVKLDESDDVKRMLVHYYFPTRDEHLCRRVLAPDHFKKGFRVYWDRTDSERDQLIVSMQDKSASGREEITDKNKYMGCEEFIAQKKQREADRAARERLPANIGLTVPAPMPSSPSAHNPALDAKVTPPYVKPDKFETKDGGIKNKNGAIPFSDW